MPEWDICHITEVTAKPPKSVRDWIGEVGLANQFEAFVHCATGGRVQVVLVRSCFLPFMTYSKFIGRSGRFDFDLGGEDCFSLVVTHGPSSEAGRPKFMADMDRPLRGKRGKFRRIVIGDHNVNLAPDLDSRQHRVAAEYKGFWEAKGLLCQVPFVCSWVPPPVLEIGSSPESPSPPRRVLWTPLFYLFLLLLPARVTIPRPTHHPPLSLLAVVWGCGRKLVRG